MFEDPVTVPDPDLQISSRPLDKGREDRSPKKFFLPFGPQFGLKIRGGAGARGPSSGFATV